MCTDELGEMFIVCVLLVKDVLSYIFTKSTVAVLPLTSDMTAA